MSAEGWLYQCDRVIHQLKLDRDHALRKSEIKRGFLSRRNDDEHYHQGVADGLAVAIERIAYQKPIPIGEALRPEDV